MTILSPCDAVEMEALMPQTVNHQGPIYIRLGKGGDPIVPFRSASVRIGDIRCVETGSDVLLISTGTATQVALAASDVLVEYNWNTEVLHVPTVKPLDVQTIRDRSSDWIEKLVVVTIEDHSIVGGLGSAVAEVLAESGWRGKFKRIGYPDVFPSGYGTQDEMRARYGISVEGIVNTVKELCGTTR
jgi:transketolase